MREDCIVDIQVGDVTYIGMQKNIFYNVHLIHPPNL